MKTTFVSLTKIATRFVPAAIRVVAFGLLALWGSVIFPLSAKMATETSASSSSLNRPASYRTMSLSEGIRSLQVYHEREWNANPVITLSGEEQIHIAFDEMSHDYHTYSYRVVHCNADWTRSSLNELEYMEGFSDNEINDYATSEGTFQDYTHYELRLPNDDVRLKCSGNYVVEIYDRSQEETPPLVWACFSVLDASIGIDARVNTTTDYANNQSYQQVEFDLLTSAISIARPESELKILVRQNRRTDNQVYGVQPQMIGNDVIHYQHRDALIFKAGNEYRKAEFTTFKYAGMGVDRIAYERPFYHVYLLESDPRLSGYTYDEDQNGRFVVRGLSSDNSSIEADYYWVHFSLHLPYALPQALYLMGDMTATLPALAPMLYNESTHAYEQRLFLKQGYYNYLYMTSGTSPHENDTFLNFDASKVEGNYWQTENEYQLFVYYRPFGAQYDALIGYTELICRPSKQ